MFDAQSTRRRVPLFLQRPVAHVANATAASLFALRAQITEERLSAARAELEASAAQLDQARAQVLASEALLKDSHARESRLLEALHSLGAAPTV